MSGQLEVDDEATGVHHQILCSPSTYNKKKAAEVFLQLLDISLTFEDPFVLQGHDGT